VEHVLHTTPDETPREPRIFKLSKRTLRALRLEAAKRDCTQAEVVRLALDAYLTGARVPPPPAPDTVIHHESA